MVGKQQLADQYGIHRSTLAKWIAILVTNHEELYATRNDNCYLSFQHYIKTSRTLTPLQVQCIKKHFGEP